MTSRGGNWVYAPGSGGTKIPPKVQMDVTKRSTRWPKKISKALHPSRYPFQIPILLHRCFCRTASRRGLATTGLG